LRRILAEELDEKFFDGMVCDADGCH